MKNLRKVMATLAALSVMCMSASAFADTTVTGAFDKAAVTGDYTNVVANKQVAVNVDTTGATTGTQMTFIILDRDTDDTSVQADDILYIDQKELKSDDHGFTGVINTARIAEKEGETLDGSTIPDGSYLIKLGYTDNSGDFQIAKATMVVETGSSGAQTVTVKWGDVDLDGSADTSDMLAILYGYAGVTPTWTNNGYTFSFNSDEVTGNEKTYELSSNGTTVNWGDVDLDGSADTSDMLAVLYGYAGVTPSWTVNADEFEFNAEKQLTLTEVKE